MVDSNDRDRIEEAKRELHNMLGEDELDGSVLLVLANKNDLPNALTAAEVTELLDLRSITNRQWYVQSICATTGKGFDEGTNWFTDTIEANMRNKH